MKKSYDVVIIGAGAAGLMCALVSGQRGLSVLLVEHARKVGRKILMSGGGRCNFTNMYTEPSNFLSNNPHFCKSALSQYTQWDFINMVERHGIPYHEKQSHEKTLGQLFCDNSSKDIVQMLLKECIDANVEIVTQQSVSNIESVNERFSLQVNEKLVECGSVVVATGGLSIPSMGPHGYGYQVAEQFGLEVLPTSAALVPFVMSSTWQNRFADLSGNSVDVNVSCHNQDFREAMLFTHKGISGPSILQISSYWQPGQPVAIDLLPDTDIYAQLLEYKQAHPNSQLKTVLQQWFTRRFAQLMVQLWFNDDRPIGQWSHQQLKVVADKLSGWQVYPEKTEGYKTAEVTLGGLNTDVLSSKSMMVKAIPGLFFIGEVVDVTGHLGGFNFQWAWSSAYAAGQSVA